MPFVSKNEAGKPCFWQVEASGYWLADCDVGEEYARTYIERARQNQPPLLSWIVHDMVRAGPDTWSGIEIGFLPCLARAG